MCLLYNILQDDERISSKKTQKKMSRITICIGRTYSFSFPLIYRFFRSAHLREVR